MYPWMNPFQQQPLQQSDPGVLRAALQQINQAPQQPQQQKDLLQAFKNLYQQWIERHKSLDQKAADYAVQQRPPMGSPPGPSGDNTNSTQQQASAPPMSVTPASVGQNYWGLYTYPGMTSSYDPSPVIPSGANPSY
jgi:hypothetical protein